jgi:hypothetical protein
MEEEVFDLECESEEYGFEYDSEEDEGTGNIQGTTSPMVAHNQSMHSPLT